jgi:8-oxo-dGTP diphosphatase
MMQPRIRVSALLRWQDRILLCRHEKPGKEYWLLPGGGVDSGESLVNALQRELLEEIGLRDEIPVEGPIAIVDSIGPAAQRPVREADRWRGSGGTGRFPPGPPG